MMRLLIYLRFLKKKYNLLLIWAAYSMIEFVHQTQAEKTPSGIDTIMPTRIEYKKLFLKMIWLQRWS